MDVYFGKSNESSVVECSKQPEQHMKTDEQLLFVFDAAIVIGLLSDEHDTGAASFSGTMVDPDDIPCSTSIRSCTSLDCMPPGSEGQEEH